MSFGFNMPATGRTLSSIVTSDGNLRLFVDRTPLRPPEPDEVVVRVAAAPIHPADVMVLLAGANPCDAVMVEAAVGLETVIPLGPEVLRAAEGRMDLPLHPGLEGAGTVVAAGRNAQALAGRRVAFLAGQTGSYGDYCTVGATSCLPLPEKVEPMQAAAALVNPFTALAMVETLHQAGCGSMIHTAAASTIGRMLVRICAEDDIGLVNVVRSQKQGALLRLLGAEHVCVSGSADFRDQLGSALADTGARIAFDAIGGGIMPSLLLEAMEADACRRGVGYARYGSPEMKRIFLYGRLDNADTILPRGRYGLNWALEGWAMPPILDKAGSERREALAERIGKGLDTTFATAFGRTVTLGQMIEPAILQDYCLARTGNKYRVALDDGAT